MAEVTKRIYLVKTTQEAPGEATRLVNAPNAAQALRHVVDQFLSVELASPSQCVSLGAAGVKIEEASANPHQKRQGDVLLEWLGERESIGAARAIEQRVVTPLSRDRDGSTTLAHGEVTGHRHRFIAGPDGGSDAISYAHPVAPTEPSLVHVMERTTLRHEEHGFIDSDRGLVRISRPYEYQGAELLRRVED